MFPYVDWIDGCHIAREVSVKLQNEFKFMFREVHGLKKTNLFDLERKWIVYT